MHVEIMDQQDVHASTRLFRQMYFPSEKQVGKPNIMPDHEGINGMALTPCKISIASSPLEELLPNVTLPNCLKLCPSHVAGSQREKFHGETTASFSDPAWRYLNDHPKTWSNLNLHPASNAVNVQRANSYRIYDSGPSSTSSSEIFARKLTFPTNDGLPHQYADAAASCHEVKEPVPTKETEVDSIENLLPNEEDLFSGLTTELGSTANGSNDDEEFDIFSSGGGLELEGDCRLHVRRANATRTEGIFGEQGISNGSVNPGSLKTGSFPLNGHHHMWSNAHSFQHHPPSPMVWSSSLPFVNDVCAHSTPKVPVLFEVLPHVMYTVSPTHKHHIGSAPSSSLFGGDLLHGYVGESPKSLDIHLNSLRVGGFPSSPLLHPSEVASHNMFSQVSGNRMDMSANSGACSPQNTCNVLPGRDVATSMLTSFTSPKERHKKLSHRRHEANSGHADQKKYELDIDRVLRGEDSRTTLMIKNIPNKYTSKTLLAAIDEQNRGSYDFIYLPIDFKNKCNMGYAFINMVDPLQIIPFHKTFNGKRWEKYHSGKVASLAYARIQGKTALIAHFQDSSLMNEDKSCHPILFCTNGPNAGGQEPFPIGTGIRPRQHKTRYNVTEESQVQESPSSSLKGEEFYNASC